MSTREILRPVMMLAKRTMATMAKYTCQAEHTDKKEKNVFLYIKISRRERLQSHI
jgi:hypothetical protein